VIGAACKEAVDVLFSRRLPKFTFTPASTVGRWRTSSNRL
jgi:hypothetical protein